MEKRSELRKGDQVLVKPHISGPASGRLGFASGDQHNGHYEVLDQKPGSKEATTLGWFEPDDLLLRPAGNRSRRKS